MSSLITGSLAFDTIMVFEDQFKNHILPDQTHILNVSFLVPSMQRYLGGCAGNIAYTLKLLGGNPQIMGVAGQDFGPYTRWLAQHDISDKYIKIIPDSFTAQAFITTDIDNNQINAFHPGAMDFAQQNNIADVEGATLGIIAPNGRDGMLRHAADFVEQKIPFIFDPGQQLPRFDGAELLTFLDRATYAVANDYESEMLLDKTGLSLEELAAKVDALIITRGGKGSEIYTNGEVIHVASAPISEIVDPTGCGDAYRSGLMHGLTTGRDWKTCGQIASLCGAIKIEQSGTQQHSFTVEEFAERYQTAFGEAL